MKQVFLLIFVLTLSFACKETKTDVVEDQIENSVSETQEFVKFDASLSSGELMRLKAYPSKYIKSRPVDVWLPNTYTEDKKYSVLYMHDGQMLFDGPSTWNKQEWEVDEWASKLMEEEKLKTS